VYCENFTTTVVLEVATDAIVCSKVTVHDVPTDWFVVLCVLGKGRISVTTCVKYIDKVSASEVIEGVLAIKSGGNHRVCLLVL
jgi:hypothetical protein